MSATASNRALLGAAIAIAALCTVPVLGHRSLWLDEGVSLAFAQLSLGALFDAVHHMDAAEFAYYAFLHEWLSFVGTRAELLRLPSALAAIGVVPLTYLVAKELFGTRTAVIASFLVAPSFFIVNMAEQARPYTLALFFCVLATYFFLKLLQKPSIPYVAGYAAAAALGILFHAFSGLMIVAHVASVPLLTDDVRHVRLRLFAAYAVLGLALLPFAVLLKSVGMHQIDWIAKPQLADVGKLFGHFIDRADKPTRAIVMVGAPCCLAVIGASGAERRRVGALIVWTLLPILIAFGIFVVAAGLLSFGVLPAVYSGWTTPNGSNAPLRAWLPMATSPFLALATYARVGLGRAPLVVLAAIPAAQLLALVSGTLSALRRRPLGQ